MRDRRTFLELRRSGTRARRGPVAVIHLPDDPEAPAQHPRVAFAVPRKVGNAVVRNRIRRCVKGRLLQRVRDPRRGVAPGAYLVTVRPEAAGLGGPEIADLVEGCLDRLDRRR
ncbi:ribonuclease P protein component [Rhabdothermincola salaria]|uniref:ribonuclease P protein component n=1 Tax=Rhabdothermincola salaria TaxID=2903142 RepID=UPI001E52D1D7|nr:ribonuclease P protein component [Rhabdothermincola salaria]